MYEGWSLDRVEAGSRRPRLVAVITVEFAFVVPLAEWNN